jgi:hypothetical protein
MAHAEQGAQAGAWPVGFGPRLGALFSVCHLGIQENALGKLRQCQAKVCPGVAA